MHFSYWTQRVSYRLRLSRQMSSGRRVLSRIWCDRLLGTAAGAAITLTSLWLLLVSAAAAAAIFRT